MIIRKAICTVWRWLVSALFTSKRDRTKLEDVTEYTHNSHRSVTHRFPLGDADGMRW